MASINLHLINKDCYSSHDYVFSSFTISWNFSRLELGLEITSTSLLLINFDILK